MLQDKLEVFNKTLHVDLTVMKEVSDVIESIKPLKSKIKEACEKLKTFLDKGSAVSIDEEIKTALVSIYGIFETAGKCLDDESVAAIFET